MVSSALPKRSLFTRFTTNPYVAGSLPTIGGIMFGCDISSMSAQLSNPYYLEQFGHPDSNLQGGITASMPAGSFAGAILNSYLADKIGRKKSIILSGWVWVVGCIIQAASVNVGMLIAGRVIAGVAVGIASAMVTVYQAEISRPERRGTIVSIQQLSIMSGIFLQYFVQYGCSFIEGKGSFRIPWGLQGIPGLVLGTLMIWFPESPRFLSDKGHESAALQILADLHAEGDTEDALVRTEYNEIRAAIEFERTQAAKSYADLLKPDVRRRVFLGCMDQCWSQLSGMNVMMYYVIYVFQGAGLQGRRAELIASSVQYALAVAVTIPTVIFLDRWGRRPTMITGSCCMALFLLLVGSLQAAFGEAAVDASADDTTTWVIRDNKSVSYAIIVFSYFFVMSFSATLGPCSWTYASEIFPTRVRGKAVSFATATNWMFNFALAYAVPPMFRNIHFMAFNVCSATHFFFMFPETKGYTLEEMEQVFAGNAFTAWRAGRNVKKSAIAAEQGDVEGSAIHADEKDDLKPQISHVERI
ncbi:high affinity glucose transporter [Rhodosporidiobolus nylandii]